MRFPQRSNGNANANFHTIKKYQPETHSNLLIRRIVLLFQKGVFRGKRSCEKIRKNKAFIMDEVFINYAKLRHVTQLYLI